MKLTCGICQFYVPAEDADPNPAQASCHGLPPIVLLLPVQPSPAQQIQGRQGVAMTLQSMRPVVLASTAICSLFLPVAVR